MIKLNHRFGDDGAFWISYDDLLRKYQAFDRTRLFSAEWKVTTLWTTLSIPWTLDYHDTQFSFSLAKSGPVVIVLSQLDDRYYRGLEGQYRFTLNFRLHKAGQEDYVVRSISPYCQRRSVNVELELDAGEYTVLLKINAIRIMEILPIEEVVRNNARGRRDKLVAVGMSYDLAHSKGKVVETGAERKAREDGEKAKRDKEKRDLKQKLMEAKQREYYFDLKELAKRRERAAEAKAKKESKKAKASEKAKSRCADVPSQSTIEKHIQIQISDQKDHQLDPHSATSADSGSDTSFKTPSTGSGESSLEKDSDAKPAPLPQLTQDEDSSSDDDSDISSPSDISDQELEYQLDSRARLPPPLPPAQQPPANKVEPEDEFESNPWNAVATVGIRIYYKMSHPDKSEDIVKLRVFRPIPHAGKGKEEVAEDEMGLDVDDSSKDATLVGNQEQRKKSIAPITDSVA